MTRFRRVFIVFIVLALVVLAGFAYKKLKAPPSLEGKAAPGFVLPLLGASDKQFSANEMKGKVWLLNVWASWCGVCAAEHPALMDLAKQNIVPIYGVNYWDSPENGLSWLKHHGNPYMLVMDGRAGFDYSIRGVPDTYVIDKLGVIQFALSGELTAEIIKNKVMPLVAELEKR
jgi:cytochrome c biogenesis protein CcmG, thiol:disulfide interchange protein DsbE